MAKFSPHRLFRISLCLLFLFSGSIVYGAGQKDAELRKAEQFIEQQQYNDAILILTKLMKDKAKYAQRAGELLKKIRSMRNEYNDLYDELVRVLFEEHDFEEALDLIDQLEKISTGPTTSLEDQSLTTDEWARIITGLGGYNHLVTNISVLAAKKEYWKALASSLPGFEINRRIFEDSTTEEAVKAQVLSTVDAIYKEISGLLALERRYLEALAQLEKLSAPEMPPAPEESVRIILEVLQRTVDSLRVIRSSSETLESLNTAVTEAAGGEPDWYLVATVKLLTGRASLENQEGILFILGSMIPENLETAFSTIENAGRSAYRDAEKALALDRSAEADRLFSRLDVIHASGVSLVSRVGDTPGNDILRRDGLSLRLGSLKTLSMLSAVYRRYLSSPRFVPGSLPRPVLQERYAFWSGFNADWMKHRGDLRLFPQGSDREELEAEMEELSRLIASQVTKYREEDQRLAAEELAEQQRIAAEKRAEELRIAAEKRAEELRLTIQEITRVIGTVEALMAGLESCMEPGFSFLKGWSDPGDAAGIVKRYPDQALAVFDPILKELNASLALLSDIERRLGSEKDFIVENSTVREGAARIVTLRSSLMDPGVRLNSGRREAETLVSRAKLFRQEGELRFAEAETAIRNEQFETGRQKILKAQDSLLQSLSSQENAGLREYLDRETLRLSETITRAENITIVREVRRYITEGKGFYLQGVYDRAEDALLKAQGRWGQTNPDSNSEIDFWLGFVKSALYVKSSREIPETHSLYTEMRQLLNLARESFNRGKTLLEKGDHAAASKLFDEAEAKVLQVKVPFPFNKDANILPLQILKLRDPASFRSIFSERFTRARELLTVSPNEAYMSLKDLEEIDPAFSGLKSALYAAEVALKIRIPPPDPKALNESVQLYQQAQRIFSQNNSSQFPIAVEQLTKAIELNPDNVKAIELKDRLLMTTGGRLSFVLSSSDQQEYRVAEEKFISGKYIEALAIVERLLRKGSNDRYQPLIQLKGRIESKI